MRFCTIPGHILLNAVEAGLRLISAVARYVEGEDAQGGRLLWCGRWNLDALERDKPNKGSFREHKSEAAKMKQTEWLKIMEAKKWDHHNKKQQPQNTKTARVSAVQSVSQAFHLMFPPAISAHSSFLIFQTAFCQCVEGITGLAELLKRHSDAKCTEAKKKEQSIGFQNVTF